MTDNRTAGERKDADRIESIGAVETGAKPPFSGLSMFIFILLGFAAEFCVYALRAAGLVDTRNHSDPVNWLSRIGGGLVILLILHFYIAGKENGKMLIGIRPPPTWKEWTFTLAWIVLHYGVMFTLMTVMLVFFPEAYGSGKELTPYAKDMVRNAVAGGVFSPAAILMFFHIVILAPVVEELTFRGIGLAGYMATGGKTRAILWTSAVFGILHGWHGFPFLAAYGAILAHIRLRTGSIYCSMFSHAFTNCIACVISAAAA